MPSNVTEIEKRLWDAADELRANSRLNSFEYSTPVLGLIFLRYADMRFSQAEQELRQVSTGRRQIGPDDYKRRGVMYLPEKVYEYFLGRFARGEGSTGGEYFTPTSIVRLIVEIIEPFHGRIFDPACGSGGMFVQSARFVENHQRNPHNEISIFGQEKKAETVRLCKMNLAVHGLSGDIRQANSYYNDPHNGVGRFDFVMANPPFNVDRINKENLEKARFPLGTPRVDNGNYLWIQLFYSALNEAGRAGFVMANSAGARGRRNSRFARS